MGYVRKINVELIGATGLKNSEYLGKSDPYVILSIGTTEFRSKVAEDQATAPEWNENFVIPALESDTELSIRILNDNTMAKDDELGRVVIPLAQYRHGESASFFTLQCNGKAQGELKMNLAFEREDEHESKGLAEKIENLFVGEKKEHHEDENTKEVEEKIETQEEKTEAKKEGSEEKKEEIKEKIEAVQEKVKEEKKHKHHHRLHKHHKKSDDEGSSSSSSSSSDSDSDKDEKHE